MQSQSDKDKSAVQPRQQDDKTQKTGEIKFVEGRAHVYCSICGTSFNSDKQSDQHYRGKLHARKLRLARYLTRIGFSASDIK